MSAAAKKYFGYALGIIASAALLYVSTQPWSKTSPTEALGFITGAWCVWLTVKEHIWNFPIGIANAAFSLVVFMQARLFADSMLQVLYIILGFIGWYWWLFGGEKRTTLKVGRTPLREYPILIIVGAIATYYMWKLLISKNDAQPFLDALTTVLSLIAQYMLTRKFIENWFIWIIADIIYVGLYINRELYLYGVLYFVFLVLCIFGLKSWRESLMKNRRTDDMEIVHA